MLISFQKCFVFVANLKTASSSIENVLTKYSDISIRKTKFGKHMSATQIKNIIDLLPLTDELKSSFFWFGVIREPISYLLSIYNSHQKDAFDGKKHSTKGISFEEFIESWCLEDMNWQVAPQSERFCKENGELIVDYLIPYEHLTEGIAKVWKKLGINDELPHNNKSPKIVCESDISDNVKDIIAKLYKKDYILYEKALKMLNAIN